jgi:hypothetical protein
MCYSNCGQNVAITFEIAPINLVFHTLHTMESGDANCAIWKVAGTVCASTNRIGIIFLTHGRPRHEQNQHDRVGLLPVEAGNGLMGLKLANLLQFFASVHY